MVEWQGPQGCGIFFAFGKRTSVEIDVVRRAQDEDTLTGL
jgi:hypothetical protein